MGKLLGIYYYSESRPVAIVQLKIYKNPQSRERERGEGAIETERVSKTFRIKQ